jgi:hypothetical protein
MSWNLLFLLESFTVKPDVLLRATLQYCPQYCNFDSQIALTQTNCQLKFTKKICKQSLWLDYKKEGSTNPVAQTIWFASLFLIVQSGFVYTFFVNFNLQFVRVGCKLLRAICLSKLQYCGTILQCCSQENIRFDCNRYFKITSSRCIELENWKVLTCHKCLHNL